MSKKVTHRERSSLPYSEYELNGETKKQWKPILKIIHFDDGSKMIELDTTVNFATLELYQAMTNRGKHRTGRLILPVFDDNDEQGSGAGAAKKSEPAASQEDFSDDLPF